MRGSRSIVLTGVVLAGLAAVVLTACGGSEPGAAEGGPTGEASPAQPESSDAAMDDLMEIRVAASTPLLWPHIWVAEGADLWHEAGLDANVVQFATGGEAQQALLGGDVDVATVAPTPVTVAAHNDLPVRVFGVASRWSDWRVQARTDAGIQSARDLVGKKIGVTVGTSSGLAWNRFLALNDLDGEDFEIVNVSPPDMVPALSTGSVDAIVIWQPFVLRAEQTLGDGLTELPFEFTNNYLLTTTQSLLDSEPELVKRFMDVMAAAADLIASDPETAAGYVSEAAGAESADIVAVWAEMELELGPPDARVLEEMEFIATAAKEAGDIPEDKSLDLASIFVDVEGL